MLTAHTYKDICRQLAFAFEHRYPQSGDVRMVGILFARPTSRIAKSDIVPNLDYFYTRSADHIDFFCAGYALGPEEGQEHVAVVGSRQDLWRFNATLFDRLRKEIEGKTTWRYSGGTDLLLCNARFDRRGTKTATLEFGTCIVCVLDTMKACKAIESVEMFIESIVRFAETSRSDDPTWGFSDQQGVRIAGSALKRLVLSLIPKKLGDDAVRAAHFAVHDVTA